MKTNLLVDGNSKTGSQVALFNLPRLDTCPGASETCRALCYGKAFKRFGWDEKYKSNWDRSKDDKFVPDMIAEIKARGYKVVRIHSIGDFYDGRYVGRWIKIIRALPHVIFYAYTRSWRTPDVRRALLRMNRLPNVQLWWSTDKETGAGPEGRTTYMAVDDTDLPAHDVSLIFRVKRDTYRATMGEVRVCPKERCAPDHAKYPDKMTCFTCKLCFRHAITTKPADNPDSKTGTTSVTKK